MEGRSTKHESRTKSGRMAAIPLSPNFPQMQWVFVPGFLLLQNMHLSAGRGEAAPVQRPLPLGPAGGGGHQLGGLRLQRLWGKKSWGIPLLRSICVREGGLGGGQFGAEFGAILGFLRFSESPFNLISVGGVGGSGLLLGGN